MWFKVHLHTDVAETYARWDFGHKYFETLVFVSLDGLQMFHTQWWWCHFSFYTSCDQNIEINYSVRRWHGNEVQSFSANEMSSSAKVAELEIGLFFPFYCDQNRTWYDKTKVTVCWLADLLQFPKGTQINRALPLMVKRCLLNNLCPVPRSRISGDFFHAAC